MARHTAPKCKLCRREGTKLYLKGTRCASSKCAWERRKFAPGQHGPTSRRKVTDYAIHLREKQKTRRIYGVLEKQFRKYFYIADKKVGITGENLLEILERRLDNVLYRMGFAFSRSAARQIIRHGHVLVNGMKVNIPSFLVKPNTKIEIKEGYRSNLLLQEAIESVTDIARYAWLDVDKAGFSGVFLYVPKKEEIGLEINDNLIVEYYSK
jgi:small subunit ribosomal protein S4